MMRFFRSGGVVLLAIVSAAMLPGAAAAQSTAPDGSDVTFTKDVAPILQRSCLVCHRPGEMAPMSLMTYEDARPWARAIRERVAAREMPPWHIDRNIGIQQFKNDRSLTDEEVATIVQWVDSGAPRGNPADMPPPPQFPDTSAWQFEPDVVVKYPKHRVPAEGPDLFGSLYADFGLEEDRYIKAIQTRAVGAESRQVVHHALSYAVEPDYDDEVDDGTGDAGQFLVEYASGKGAEVYPSDSGVLLQAGKKARVSYHLHSIGEAVDAAIELGIAFHPKGTVPKHIRWSKQTAQPQSDIDIPAGTIVRKDGYTRFSNAARITAFQPHTHIRGKYQCLELIYPSQPIKTEVVSCANWNFNWHLIYNYDDKVAPLVPAGTILHVITWYDNSQANRHNPDPKNWVGNGQRTIDEMGFAWIGWYDLTDEEYKQELEVRQAEQPKAVTTNQQQQ